VVVLRLTFVPVVASLLLVRTAAAASNGKLDMSWQAPQGCPSYTDVESWLHAVIPPDARQRLGELHVKVVISGTASSGFSASVRVTRDAAPGATAPSELRVVEGPACEEVARSAIVVVSVAMSDALKAAAPQPVAARPAPEPSREPASQAPLSPTPLVVPAPPRDQGEPATPPTRAEARLLTLAGGVGSGFAEQPGLRVDASALFALSRSIFLGPRVHALPSVTIRREDEVATLHFLAAGAELCALPELSAAIHGVACGRVEAGFAWSRGARSGDPSASGPVAAVAVSPGLSIGRRVRFLMQGDFELRLLRPRFENVHGEVLAALPILAGSGLLGLSLAIP
jgi:hypothetical protein